MNTKVALGLALALTTLSCGGDAACVPGEQVECACPGGTVGAQACNGEGSAFGDCSCDGTNPSDGGSSPLNACEAYAALAEQRVAECDIEVTGGAPEGGASPCTPEAAATAQCVTPCLEDASCATLNGDDLDGLEDYADCVGGCVE